MFLNPESLLEVWAEKPIPLKNYNFRQIEIQTSLNKEGPDGIITNFDPINNEWNEIDVEPITPYTWKWVDLKLVKADGSISWASLRRPNWWLKKMRADKVGNVVFLDMPEMGMEGLVTVANIRVNRVDTRIWEEDHVQPITGKFKHESENIFWLYFLKEGKPLGVTGNHLIWSETKKKWVAASELQKGEKVKSYFGFAELESIEKSNKREVVYNLEIYRDHNFYVSLNSVLVHNECWNGFWEKVWHEWGVRATKVGGGHGWVVGRTEDHVRRIMIDFKHTPKGDLTNFSKYEITKTNDNYFLKNLEFEESIARSDKANKIVLKMMVEDVPEAQLRSGIRNLEYMDYKIREYEEFGMKWVEGTRTFESETVRPPAFK